MEANGIVLSPDPRLRQECAVIEEIMENEGLPATVHPADWARVSGRRGAPVTSMTVRQRPREE